MPETLESRNGISAASFLEDAGPFGRLFTADPDPMWIFDLETWQFLEVNPAATRRYGYSREEFLGGLTVADIRSPEESRRLRRELPEMPDKFHEAGIYRHRTRAGEAFDAEISTYPLTFRGKRARLVRAVPAEERRRMHRETLKSSAARLFDDVGDVVSRIDSNWRFVDANRVLTERLGCDRDGLIGRGLWDVLPQLKGTLFEEQLQIAMTTRQPVHFTAKGPKTGRWFETHAYPEGESDLTVVTRDINDRKSVEFHNEELQAQLRHAQRMETLGEMVSGIAHDFNNLLTIMAVSLEQLKPPRGPDSEAPLARLDSAISRAAELSRRLLSYSRNDPETFRKTDINECIGQTLALLAASTDRRIQFVTALDPDCRYVRGDAHQLEHVFLNLVINACDALAPRLARSSSGRIHVKSWRGVLPEELAAAERLDAELEYLCLLFEDNGQGMPEDVKARVFEPYFTTKTENHGTGLGLSISRGTIRAHGGAITVESEAEVGTRFLVYLPVYRHVAPPALAPGEGTETRRARARILAVEDEEPLRELLEEILAPLGYEVVLAENGRRAVDLYANEPDTFDAVLLDFNMPGLNGVSALRAIRALRPSAKVLMMTGYTDERATRELAEGGPQAILFKPYRPSELQQRLAELLASSLN